MAQVAEELQDRLTNRLADNVRWLIEVNEFSTARTAGLAEMGESTLRKMLNQPEEVNPGLSTIEALARALGVGDPMWLLMTSEELQAKVEEEGLSPFVLRRPARISSVSTSSAASAADNLPGKLATVTYMLPSAQTHPPRVLEKVS